LKATEASLSGGKSLGEWALSGRRADKEKRADRAADVYAVVSKG
jgi:hypothetical protein